MTTFNAITADAFDLSATAGYQLALGARAKAQLCPVASLASVRGPKDLDGNGTDYNEQDFAVGLNAGFVATLDEDVRLIPMAGIALANANVKLTNSFGASTSSWESFGVFTVGAGVVFGREVSLKPSLLVPFGLRGASTTLVVSITLGLGGGR
jgi:opacity protein-like surface antigen